MLVSARRKADVNAAMGTIVTRSVNSEINRFTFFILRVHTEKRMGVFYGLDSCLFLFSVSRVKLSPFITSAYV